MKQIAVDEAAARRFHQAALVINALDSTLEDKFTEDYVQALIAGGINALNVTVPRPEHHFRDAIRDYVKWRRRLSALSDAVRIVRRAGDIGQAKEAGQIAVILGFQNAKAIEDDLALLEVFHRLDVRVVQLTYEYRNYIGNGVGERVDGGLSRFGVVAVQEMNRLGIVVDLSHVGERSSLDAVEASSAPVIVSHTVAKAVHNHFRGVSDDILRAVAARGGCIGVAGLSLFLRDDGVERGSTLGDYVDHMEHMIDVAGIDHVGIGFDIGFKRTEADSQRIASTYSEFAVNPPLALRYATEINRADKVPNLTVELLRRGYREDDVRKVLGLNWYRVFSQVWGE
jgi:membrane dipeptidase